VSTDALGGGQPPKETLRPTKRLLIVVRNLTSLNRLLTVLPALALVDFIAIKFVVDDGSSFSRDIGRYLTQLGAEVLTWEEAVAAEFDAILAAHANTHLWELNGPLMVIPHGAGYNRLVPSSTADTTSAVGLSSNELLREGKVIPTLIGLSHREQLDRLRQSCPEAVDRALIFGDPVIDQMEASKCRVNHYREQIGLARGQHLVVVSSTWNEHSLLAKQQVLVNQLLAQLPMDEFCVALVLHPNIWFGHSEFEILHTLQDAQDSGLLIVPPDGSWQAFLLAADVIIGDHGSVSFYGAALGRPFLLAADGTPELDPECPTARFCEAADRLDIDGDLRAQLISAMLRNDPDRLIAITDQTFAHRGQSWKTLQAALFDLMRLPAPSRGPRMMPVPDPVPLRGEQVTSYVMSASIHDTEGSSARIELERFPAIMAEESGPYDSFLVVDAYEVDEALRRNAEIFVNNEVLTDQDAAAWIETIFLHYPGACLVAAATESGCALRFSTGLRLSTSGADPLLASSAIYRWSTEGHPVTANLRLRVRMGHTESVVAARPATPMVNPI
jgi:hypothetical protein